MQKLCSPPSAVISLPRVQRSHGRFARVAAITVLARMKFPFEASPAEVVAAPDRFIDAVFASLASEFLVLPKGKGFVEYADFQAGYEELKKATRGFTALESEQLIRSFDAFRFASLSSDRCWDSRRRNGLTSQRKRPASLSRKVSPEHSIGACASVHFRRFGWTARPASGSKRWFVLLANCSRAELPRRPPGLFIA